MDIVEKKGWIEKFEQFSIGNVADAMDKLGMKRRIISGLSPLYLGEKKTAGFARTIEQKKRVSEWNGTNLAKHGNIIDTQVQFGDIVVIATHGYTNCSTGGGILALRAKMSGARGEITDGCLRDADEFAKIEFPVYASGTNGLKSALDLETVGSNIPVTIKGITIYPDDLLLLDATGIVCVPISKLDVVYHTALAIKNREAKMVALIESGQSLLEARKIELLS